MQKLILLFLSILFPALTFAQQLVSAQPLSQKSDSEVIAQYDLPPVFVKNGVEMYKLRYTTLDVHGLPDTASGLVVVPDVPGTYPLLCYQHGTVGSRNDVPSNLQANGYPRGDELPVPFCSFGYVVAAADYLGLGDSKGFHPYVHAKTEASAAIDLLFATQEFMNGQVAALNDQLFITGYSQGGHSAMAAYWSIQEDYANDFTVTAAAPMSGPYSISGAMKEVILSDDPYYFAAYLPNTILSYDLAYDLFDDIGEYFKEPYATSIRQYYNEQIDLWTLNSGLITMLTAEEGGSFPKYMLQDSILAMANEENHPLNYALRANDVYDWQPMAPTRLYYCTADDQVTFRNSVIADSVMQANNAPDVGKLDVEPTADHGGCINPAATATLLFFAQFQEVSTSVSEQSLTRSTTLRLSPNPAQKMVHLQWEGEETLLELYNAKGKVLRSVSLAAGQRTSLDVGQLPRGLYFLLASDGRQKVVRKLVLE